MGDRRSLDGEVSPGAPGLFATTADEGAAGDGGAVFTDDAALADKVRRLGNHGRTAHYGYGDVGWNSRLHSLQAAFLNLSLDHIAARIASVPPSRTLIIRQRGYIRW